jgi:hypothetical protein
MDPDFEERSRRRRQLWTGGVAATHEEAELADYRFWASASPSDRFDAIRLMAIEAAIISGNNETSPRLSGPPFGIRKLGS